MKEKARLPMTREDCLNRAWQFVTFRVFSKKEIAEACGVSTSTVGRMRAGLALLQKTRSDEYLKTLGDYKWKEVFEKLEETTEWKQ